MSEISDRQEEAPVATTQQATMPSAEEGGTRRVHIAILGTGFSGLGMAIELRRHGYTDFVVIERKEDMGGTWHDNTYPGCACDIPSHLYSFSFAPNPNWSRWYSPQHEIQAYLRDCAQRFGVLPYIQWKCELLEARWHEQEQRWYLKTSQGNLVSDILILGNGPLSEPTLPAIRGIEQFEGELIHTARWKPKYDLRGKRVAVIGTGASAIQLVPQIQPLVSSLTLFQRTPAWIVPRGDHPISVQQQQSFRRFPLLQRLVRAQIYWLRELNALGLLYQASILKLGMRIAHQHLARQVLDPVLREKLTPRYTMGCKRVLVSDDFYPTLTRPNVELVIEHIREIRPHSIVTDDGKKYEIDVLICATGFHVTDTHLPNCIYGRGGESLAASWYKGIHAYLGTSVANFPNLFLLIGPNTGLGHNSMIFMLESQLAYLLDCLRTMKRRKLQAVEVRADVENAYNAELQRRMGRTVWKSGCASWYLDAQGRNTTLWPGFTFEFRRRTRHFNVEHYLTTTRRESS